MLELPKKDFKAATIKKLQTGSNDLGFPGDAVVKNLPTLQEMHAGSISGSGRPPQNRKQQPTPIFLPGKLHGERSLAGYHPWGHKESDMTERLSKRAPLKYFNK